MADMTSLLVTVGLMILLFIISALPLHFAVKLLGGKSSILKAFIITLISGFVVSIPKLVFDSWGGIIGMFLLIWIYREVFRLKWLKAFLAWILQMIFIFVFSLIFGALGIGLVGASFLF